MPRTEVEDTKRKQDSFRSLLLDCYISEEIKNRNKREPYSYRNIILFNLKMICRERKFIFTTLSIILLLITSFLCYRHIVNNYADCSFYNSAVERNFNEESFGDDIPNIIYLAEDHATLMFPFDISYRGNWQKEGNKITVILDESFSDDVRDTYVFDVNERSLYYAGYRYGSVVPDDSFIFVYILLFICAVILIVSIAYFVKNIQLFKMTGLESLTYSILWKTVKWKPLDERKAFDCINTELVLREKEKISHEVYDNIIMKFLELKLISIENGLIVLKKKPLF